MFKKITDFLRLAFKGKEEEPSKVEVVVLPLDQVVGYIRSFEGDASQQQPLSMKEERC